MPRGQRLDALDRDRYDVIPVGIARDGHWAWPDDAEQFRLTSGHRPSVDTHAPERARPDQW